MRTNVFALVFVLLINGCAGIPGRVRPSLPSDASFAMLPKPVELFSGGSYDCGPEALHAVMSYYGDEANLAEITEALESPGVEGTFPPKLVEAARAHGYQTRAVDGSFTALKAAIDAGVPAILLIRSSKRENHYVVAIGYCAEKDLAAFEFYHGWKWVFTRQELEEAWRPCGFLQLELLRSPLGAALDQARKLEGEGRAEEALAIYRSVIADDSENLSAHFGAGNCLALMSELQAARVEYLIALNGGLQDPELWNNLADICLQAGETDDRVLGWANSAVQRFEDRLGAARSDLAEAIWTRKLALALGTLGAIQKARGETIVARANFYKSLELLGECEPELRQRRLAQIASCGD